LTNVADGEQNEEDQIIKLKIKRRRKINRGAALQREAPIKIARNQGEYVKLDQVMEEETPIIIEQPAQ